MRISDWSSDVCSSDLLADIDMPTLVIPGMDERHPQALAEQLARLLTQGKLAAAAMSGSIMTAEDFARCLAHAIQEFLNGLPPLPAARSEEHTSELRPLMRNSYAACTLNKKTTTN